MGGKANIIPPTTAASGGASPPKGVGLSRLPLEGELSRVLARLRGCRSQSYTTPSVTARTAVPPTPQGVGKGGSLSRFPSQGKWPAGPKGFQKPLSLGYASTAPLRGEPRIRIPKFHVSLYYITNFYPCKEICANLSRRGARRYAIARHCAAPWSAAAARIRPRRDELSVNRLDSINFRVYNNIIIQKETCYAHT